MRKVSVIVIAFISVILLVSCSRDNIIATSKLEYSVYVSSSDQRYQLGTYTITYYHNDSKISESKEYMASLFNQNDKINSINEYYYDKDGRVISALERELFNDEERYRTEFTVNYSNPEEIRVTSSYFYPTKEKKQIKLEYNNNFSINSSYILFKTCKNTPIYEEELYSLDVSGFFDKYENLGSDIIDIANLGEIDCIKIMRTGMFKTIYWISKDKNKVVKIEQVMDDDFILNFQLEKFS